MWFESWNGDLVFGNESLLAYEGCRYRKMRPMKSAGDCTRKHIAVRSAAKRRQATAAKDG